MTGNPQLENGFTKIANELLDALVKYRISGEQMQCLLFILRKTYGYNKKTDYISNSQFVEATGLKRQHVNRAINGLIDRKLVTKDGSKKIPSYCFNKRCATWKLYPKKVTVTKKGSYPPKSVTKKGAHKRNNITKENMYPDWLNLDLWKEFKIMRTKKKKPLTERAEKMAIAKLKSIIDLGHNQKDVVEATIYHCWDKFYPPKEQTEENGFLDSGKSEAEKTREYLNKVFSE